MWGNFVNLVMNLLRNFITLVREKLNFLWVFNSPQNSPPPPLPIIRPEEEYYTQNATTAEGRSHPMNNAASHMMLMQWLLIGVCVAIIGTTVQALQLVHSVSFHWVCMALVFSLSAVLVFIHIPGDYKHASLLVVHVGIFSVFTALVVVLVINLPLPFKVTSIAVYFIGILIIIFANLCKPKP